MQRFWSWRKTLGAEDGRRSGTKWRRNGSSAGCRGVQCCVALSGAQLCCTGESMEAAGGSAEGSCGPARSTSAGTQQPGNQGGWAGGNWMATHPTVGMRAGRGARGASVLHCPGDGGPSNTRGGCPAFLRRPVASAPDRFPPP